MRPRAEVVGAITLCLLLDLICLVSNFAGLKHFAGRDAGFAAYNPDMVLQLAGSAWNFKDSFGLPDLFAPFTMPFALLLCGLSRVLGPGAAGLEGPLLFGLALVIVQIGAASLAYQVARIVSTKSSQTTLVYAATLAALIASFNTYIAVLLANPVLNFQIEIVLWPCVFAYALFLLTRKVAPIHWLLFSLLFALAISGNQAHTVIGTVSLGLFALMVPGKVRRPISLLAITGATFAAELSYIIIPLLGAAFSGHGQAVTREALKADQHAMLLDQMRESARASLSNLIRFDGDAWWSQVPSAEYFDIPIVRLCSFFPLILALCALRRRSRLALFFFLFLCAGLFFAKDVHGPFPLNTPAIMAHVGAWAAFRESYDKFELDVLLALPTLAAIGFIQISSRRAMHGFAVSSFLVAFVAGLPFFIGRVATPEFQTTPPRDYGLVQGLLSRESRRPRILVLPGNYLDLNSAYWFMGMNLDSYLLNANTVDGTVFRERGLSSAPIYGDQTMQAISDLPTLLNLATQYGVDYVLLHKDAVAEHSRHEPDALIYGPLFVHYARTVLGYSHAVKKIYEGHDLALYRLAASSYFSASKSLTYLDGRITDVPPMFAGAKGAVPTAMLVSGSMNALRAETLHRLASVVNVTFAGTRAERALGLYPEQSDEPASLMRRVSSAMPKPSAWVLQSDRGDYLHPHPWNRHRATWTFESSASQPLTAYVRLDKNAIPQTVIRRSGLDAVDAFDRHSKRTLPRPVPLYREPIIEIGVSSPPRAYALTFNFVGTSGTKVSVRNDGVPAEQVTTVNARRLLQRSLDVIFAKELRRDWYEPSFRDRPFFAPLQADDFLLKSINLGVAPGAKAFMYSLTAQPERFRDVPGIDYTFAATAVSGCYKGRRCDVVFSVPPNSRSIDLFAEVCGVAGAASLNADLADGRRIVEAPLATAPSPESLTFSGTGISAYDLPPVSRCANGGTFVANIDPEVLFADSGRRGVLRAIRLRFDSTVNTDSNVRAASAVAAVPGGGAASLPELTIDRRAVKATVETADRAAGVEIARFDLGDISAGRHSVSVSNAAHVIDGLTLVNPSTQHQLPAVVKYSPIDSAAYALKLNGDERVLVQASTYNAGWALFSAERPENRILWALSLRWLGRQVAADHFMVDGYANGWLLRKPNHGSLLVDFVPQDYLVIGIILSSVALFVATILCIWFRNARV